jgi:hypothetical protein
VIKKSVARGYNSTIVLQSIPKIPVACRTTPPSSWLALQSPKALASHLQKCSPLRGLLEAHV